MGRTEAGRREGRKKYLLCCLVLLMMAALVSGLYLSALAEGDDPSDLANFIDSGGVRIEDSEGNPVSEDFMHGKTYSVFVTFTESLENGQFAYDGNGYLTYKLPDALEVVSPIPAVEDGDPGRLFITVGGEEMVVGTFTLSGDGVLKVRYGEFDQYGAPTPGENYVDALTDVEMTIEFFTQFAKKADIDDLVFGTDAVVIINSVEYPEPALLVDKAAGGFDRAAEKISYTVTVTAPPDNADADPQKVKGIYITDVLQAGDNVTVNGSTVTVSDLAGLAGTTPLSIYENIRYSVAGGGEETDGTAGMENGKLRYDFPAGLELSPGQSIILSYDLNVSELVKANPEGTTRTPLDYSIGIKNTVTANGIIDGEDGYLANPPTDTCTVVAAKDFIYKTGYYNSGVIHWNEIWVGDGSVPLNGKTISDGLGAANSTLDDHMGFPGLENITVKFYSKPSTLGNFDGIPAETKTAKELADLDPSCFMIVADPTGFDYEFILTVPGDTLFGPIYRVEFAYDTNPLSDGQLGQSVMFKNTVSYENISASKTITVAASTSVIPQITSKTSSKIKETEAGSGEYIIHYDVNITVPAEVATKKFFFYDRILVHGVQANNVPRNLSVTVGGEKISAYKFWQDGYTFAVYFGEGATQETSTWQYNDTRTMVISYDLPLSGTLIGSPGVTILDKLKEAKEFELTNFARLVSGGMYPSPAEKKHSEKTVTDYWPVHKSVVPRSSDPSVFDYSVIINNSKSIPIFKEGEALFTDTFDERLEYIPGTLAVKTLGSPYAIYVPYDAEKNELPLVKGSSIEVDLSEMALVTAWKGSPAASDITVDFADTDWYTNYTGNTFEITYSLRIKDPLAIADTARFDNTAKVAATARNPVSVFENDTSATYARENPLAKTMTTDGTNMAEVEIIVNPFARDLSPDDSFEAVDLMSDTLAIYINTVELFTKVQTDGVWGEWQPVTVSETPDTLWFVDSDSAQQASFVLPDATPVKIVYRALVVAPIGQEVTISNTVSIFGTDYSAGDSEGSYHIKNIYSNTTGSMSSVTLYKEDAAEVSAKLDGAVFGLYMATPSGNPYDGQQTDYVKHGGKKFYYITDISESTGGRYPMASKWMTPSHKGIYLLAEKTAPAGYILPSAPDNYTFFTLHVLAAEEKLTLETALEKTVQFTADNIHITNTVKPVVAINKEDAADATKKLDGAAFGLYMAIPSGEPYDGQQTVFIEHGGKKFYYISDISASANGRYPVESEWMIPTYQGVYLLAEKTAPAGYILPSAPDNYTFFTLHVLAAEEKLTLETALGKTVQFTADNIHITNTVKPTPPPLVPPSTPDTTPNTVPDTVPSTPPSSTPSTVPSTVPSTPPGTIPSTAPSSTPDTPPDTPPEEPTSTPEVIIPPEDPPAAPPGGNDPQIPPVPQIPGHAVVPNEDGGYLEIGDDGVPLGSWNFDDDEGMYIYEPLIPLTVDFSSGRTQLMILLLISAIGMAYCLLIMLDRRAQRRRRGQ